MDLYRGDICLVDFNPAKSGEMGKLRPAVIVSDFEDNEILDTVMVIPLSTVIVKNSYPYRYFVTKRDKLQKDSDVCINEIRSLSKIRVKEKIAKLTANELNMIINSLCSILQK
jgi:mRNA interferase MazF